MIDILAFILLIGVLITVHEFGHYAVAKLCGVKVEVFSIGFGSSLIQFKRGDTEYRIAWIPLGGYVRLLGMDPDNKVAPEDVGRSLNDRGPFIRILIFAAGPAMNLLLPFAIIIPTVALSGSYENVRSSMVGSIDQSMPGYKAGLRAGDRIVSMDDQSVDTFWQVRRHLDAYSPEQGPIQVGVERAGSDKHTFAIVPQATKRTDTFLDFSEEDYLLGYQPFFVDTTIGIIDPKSPAARAGLKTLDIIHRVNGIEVKNFVELIAQLEAVPAGQTVSVEGERKGQSLLDDLELIRARDTFTVRYTGGQPGDALGLVHGGVCVASVNPDGPAQFLKRGDCLVSVDGQAHNLGGLIHRRLNNDPGVAKTLEWVRDGTRMSGTLLRQKGTFMDPMAGEVPYWTLGFSLAPQIMLDIDFVEHSDNWSHGWFQARTQVPREISMTLKSITGMFTGAVSPTQLGGPLTIFHLAGQHAKAGLSEYLRLMVLLSLSIGLFNLLPIPLLDGGQILVATVELVTRKPLPEKVQMALQSLGVFLILALILFALGNDAIRTWRISGG